jgi:SPP1 family phage portal protein
LIEFPNSEGRLGDVELSIDMQDAYDVGVSDISSELSQMAHAFLVQEPAASSGVIEYNDVDDDFKEQVKKTGVLLGNWKFLTKDINAQAENENLARLKHDIFQASMSYDPDELSGSSGQAMTAFQIERKLTGLEQSSKDTETEFNAAFYRMDERLRVYFREFKNAGDYNLAEIDRSFPRNIPQNELQNLKDAVAAGIRLSQRNKLALAFPTIDYDQNREQLEEDAAEGVEALTSEAFGDGSEE